MKTYKDENIADIHLSMQPSCVAVYGGLGEAKSCHRKSIDIRVGPILFTGMIQGKWAGGERHVGFGLYLMLLTTWHGESMRC